MAALVEFTGGDDSLSEIISEVYLAMETVRHPTSLDV